MANTTNVGRTGEKLRIDQSTFEVIGVDSGEVFAQGTSLAEALALQTQLQSGSAPSLKGAPDVFAVEPTAEQVVEPLVTSTGEEIEPRVATPEELAGTQPVTSEFIEAETADEPQQIRDVAELESLAALGLTEADIIWDKTRQDKAIFLKPGITEDFLRSRGTVATDQIGAGTADLVPTTTDITPTVDIAEQQLAADRTTVLGEIVGDETIAEQEAALLQTLGEGIIEQERALRELPETIQERTERVGVTQAQLNRLVATEREPMAQALKDLLLSRSLLQEQIAFRREETALAEARQEKSFSKLLAAGVGDTQFFAELDAAQGLPEGTHNSIFNAQIAANEREAQLAAIDATDKIVGILKDVPLGQEVNIGGSIFTGFSTSGLIQGTEKDNLGNVTAFAVDPISGKTFSMSLGQIGTSSSLDSDGNPIIGDSGNLLYTNGLYEAFPDGSFGGQCGEWVHNVVDIPEIGDSFESKMAAITQVGRIFEPSQVQSGDVFVQDIGTYGHIGIVNDKRFNEDTGKYEFRVSESNRKLDERVTHGEWLTEDQIQGFGRAPIKSGMRWGTDGPTSEPDFDLVFSGLPTGTLVDVTTGERATEELNETTLLKFNGLKDAYAELDEIQRLSDEVGGGSLTRLFSGTLGKFLTPEQREQRLEFNAAVARYNSAIKNALLGAAQSPQELKNVKPFLIQPRDTQLKREAKIASGIQRLQDQTINLTQSFAVDALVNVIERSTGESGKIPLSEFDPELYIWGV